MIVCDTNRPSVCFDDRLAQIQSQPKAATIVRYFMFSAVEFIKDFLLFCVADAMTGVSNIDFCHAPLFRYA